MGVFLFWRCAFSKQTKYFISGLGGVILPLVQAIVTGLLVSLVVLAFAIYQGHAHPWKVAGVAWPFVSLFSWLAGLSWWRSVVGGPKQSTEPIPGIVYGAAAEPAETIRIELSTDNGRSVDYCDLPITLRELIELSVGLCDGATFSDAAWTGKGNLFPRAKFSRLRVALLKRGLIQWNTPGTPARGVSITRAGWACFRHFGEQWEPTTPLPEGEGWHKYP